MMMTTLTMLTRHNIVSKPKPKWRRTRCAFWCQMLTAPALIFAYRRARAPRTSRAHKVRWREIRPSENSHLKLHKTRNESHTHTNTPSLVCVCVFARIVFVRQVNQHTFIFALALRSRLIGDNYPTDVKSHHRHRCRAASSAHTNIHTHSQPHKRIILMNIRIVPVYGAYADALHRTLARPPACTYLID